MRSYVSHQNIPMIPYNTFFEDSRDCAEYLVENWLEELAVPESTIKVLRRMALAREPFPVESELANLSRILKVIVPDDADNKMTLPMEILCVMYCAAELMALRRDEKANGALQGIRQAAHGLDELIADNYLSLHDELLGERVREVLFTEGIHHLVLSEHTGAVDLEWVREFGCRLIIGDDLFGFDPDTTRLLDETPQVTLLALEDASADDAMRYSFVLPESDSTINQEVFERLQTVVLQDDQSEDEADDEEGRALGSPEIIRLGGDSPTMLMRLAQHFWHASAEAMTIVITPDAGTKSQLISALTAGLDAAENGKRVLH